MILVVDDDPDVRALTVAILEDAEHGVVEAGNGYEALRILEGNADVRLLLTDIRMPQLDGIVLADMATFKWPRLKIAYLTGYADNADILSKAGRLHGPVLTKPYSARGLVNDVKAILAA